MTPVGHASRARDSGRTRSSNAALVASALAALVAGSVAAQLRRRVTSPSSARPPPPRRPSRPRHDARRDAAAGVEKLPILIVAAGIEGSGHHMRSRGARDKAIASGRVARFNSWFQQLGGDIDGDYDRDAVRAEGRSRCARASAFDVCDRPRRCFT